MKSIKPSELIRLAIHDLEVVESKPNEYSVNMNHWHRVNTININGNKICTVCLAGAVMATTFHCPSNVTKVPSDNDIPEESRSYLYALNCFQAGFISTGLDRLDMKDAAQIDDAKITPNKLNPQIFKKDMLNLADKLQEKGL